MMKLAPCPDCKNMCSVAAAVCPRCGRVFQEGERAASREVFKRKVAADSRKSFVWAIVAFIVLLILFLIGNSVRITDEDRMRQIRKNQQTGREMYR
jgi:uncharacterized membrane protein YvbJ